MQCVRSGRKRATGGVAAVSLRKHNGEGLDASVELGFPHTSRSTLGSKRCPSVWIQKTRPSPLENVCQSSTNGTVCRAESNTTAVPFDLCNATPPVNRIPGTYVQMVEIYISHEVRRTLALACLWSVHVRPKRYSVYPANCSQNRRHYTGGGRISLPSATTDRGPAEMSRSFIFNYFLFHV